MDFAPYQSSPPEHSRVASPEYASPRASWDAVRRSFSPVKSPPPLQHPQPHRGWSNFDGQASGWVGSPDNRGPDQQNPMPGSYPAAEVSEFDTSMGMRLDYEACLAYLAFPPLGAIVLLMLERNSDYVRFHAWQSALLFTAIMVFHLIFSWSTLLSWVFFLAELGLIAAMAFKAYKDAEILDRFEVPFFGRIASHIVDDE